MAGNKKFATWAVSLTNFLDSSCIVAGASGLTLWTSALKLDNFQVGLLGALSANAFGSAIGALIGGHLSDKYGRKVIYTYDMLVYMLGTLIVVFSMNFPMLLAGFIITSIAVGAGVLASWTYISETSDEGNRAKNIGISQFSWSMSPVIIFVAGTLLAPLGLLGNRILFALLTLIAFIAWLLQRGLDESQEWVEQKQKEKETGERPHPYKDLFSNAVSVKSVLFLIGVYMFWNLVAGAMGFFMPFVYETVGDLSNLQANLLQAVLWIFTALAGYFGFAMYGDKVSHRGFYFVGAAMAVISWLILTYVGMSWTALIAFVVIWGISAGIGAQAWYALWATELFPTKYRAGSQGVMFFVVRGSAGIWSIFFPLILQNMGFKAAGTFMIDLLVVSLVIGTLWTPKTRGKSLDEITKERYAEIGVDTEKAIEQLSKVKLSIHSWQGDDIYGFLNPDQELTGGIGVSGNYPGIARTPDELTQDLHEGLSLIPGKHKIQLHTLYAVTDRKKDFDEVGPEDFKYWVDWAKEEGVGLDMNGTFFSHPKVKHNFTLASPEKEIRDFWIKVGKQSRAISNYFGEELGQQSVNNFWIPDGFKDNPIDKLSPRKRLIESLDEIIKEKYDEKNTIEAFEGKLFGTGIESYTVGSHLFYNNYAITRDKLWTIDAGHWHPTEDVSDKFSAFMPFGKGLMLHVSRPVRWDSDHVVIFDDALVRIARSLVRDDLLSKTNIGLDFFDATINRVAAWVIGARSTQKALLQAMLAPIDDLKKAENEYDFTKRLAVTEELKSFPFGAVWDEFCQRNNVPVGLDWMDEIRRYEKAVQFKRN